VRIFITGISGFIGSSFGHYAHRAGHTIMGTGRSNEPGERWAGLYTPNRGADLSNLIEDFSPDVLFNASGTASVAASLDDPLNDFSGSVESCANVLDAVRRSGKRPIVVIPSSAAVYGQPVSLPVDEDAALQPISPYGFHKAASELLAREYAECFGFNVIICRFFSVFGVGQRRLLVWELYKQLAGSESTAWLDGTGEETRDFLYIDDLASALIELLQKQRPENECQVINVAGGVETSVLSLAETIRDLVAPDKDIRCRGNLRQNDPLRWCADISRLQTLVPSWRARPLRDGLELCIAGWQK
jgi:UDP-glucose 4-epimerase